LLSGVTLVVAASPAGANPPTALYASPTDKGVGTCLSPAESCTLAEALSIAGAGSTIYLTQPGTQGTPSSYYVGNWNVDPPDTSAQLPLTIEPEPGVSNPILDGNGGSATNCPTTTCNGSMLSIGTNAYVDIAGLTIQHADTGAHGGAIANILGGIVSVSDSTFSGDTALDGGAIDNVELAGTGTLTVSDSTFSSDVAGGDGGAIDNGDGTAGILTISDSTFANDSARNNGGAIDNGDGPNLDNSSDH
jgi:hypothetical protein